MARKARLSPGRTVPALPVDQRHGFKEVLRPFSEADAVAEAGRCLDCDDLCSLCVTVCPNRANLAYATAPLRLDLPRLVQRGGRLVAEGSQPFQVEQAVQTLNIADFCNECGNCTTFCPSAGAPYQDKPRFWIDAEGFRTAQGDAFRMERGPAGLVLEARLGGREHRLEVGPDETRYRSGQISARFRTGSWAFGDCSVQGVLAEGTRVDLTACATLLVLTQAEAVLPGLVRSSS
jgi:putative selenate reductase